jgi:chitodextrinase
MRSGSSTSESSSSAGKTWRGGRRSRPGRIIPRAMSLAVVTTALVAGAAQAAVPTTYQDFTYTTAATSGPTADKPQSKLWYQDGSWWSLMLSPADNTVHVFELRADHTWRDTGTVVDSRANSTGDALWDEATGKLYVASRASSSSARLVRLSYNATTRRYSVDSGFPVTISPGGSESITIAKDSTGKLWATYTRQSQIWVTHSTTSDTSWVAPFKPPVGDTAITSDDISSIVTMRGKIGLMWSDQLSQSFRFITHTDGAPDTADGWGALEKPLAGTRLADDHISIKNIVADDDGRLFAAIKTSMGDDPADPPTAALISLLVRNNAGVWTSHTFGTVADDHTRPMVMLDETNREIYVFATFPVGGGAIYYKTSPMDNISFAPGRGPKFVTWTGARINDASGSKQPVNAKTGMVVLASDATAFRYYHSEMSLGPADTQAPSVPGGVTASAVSPTRVDLAWTGSSDNQGVAGYRIYRNGTAIGTTSSTSYSDTTAAPSSTYSYTVDAVDTTGNRSAQSDPASVTTPNQPGAAIALRGSSFAANVTATTLTIPAPAGAQAGNVELMAIAARGAPRITPPAGWTLVRQDSNGTTMTQAIYTHVVGSAEPGAYTWTLSTSQAAAGGIMAYSGVRSVTPVAASGGQANASSTTVTAPSITAPQVGGQLVGFFGIGNATTFTPPAGMAERGDLASTAGTFKVTLEAADATVASAGATGLVSARAVNAAASVGQLVALAY